jgi:hypothetical protein
MTVMSFVPLAHVRSVPRAVEVRGMLGFGPALAHTPEGGGEPVWARLTSDDARRRLAQAGDRDPVHSRFRAPQGGFRVPTSTGLSCWSRTHASALGAGN